MSTRGMRYKRDGQTDRQKVQAQLLDIRNLAKRRMGTSRSLQILLLGVCAVVAGVLLFGKTQPHSRTSSEVLGSTQEFRAELGPATTFSSQTASRIELSGSEAWDDFSVRSVRSAISLLPDHVQMQLGNPLLGPIRILVDKEGRSLRGEKPYSNETNYFSTNDGMNEVVLYPGQSIMTVVHELGHAYNLRNSPPGGYTNVLLEPEMKSFMEMSGWAVLTPVGQVRITADLAMIEFVYSGDLIWNSLSRNNPLEDFASSFAMFFVNPRELASISLERHDWFLALFGPSRETR